MTNHIERCRQRLATVQKLRDEQHNLREKLDKAIERAIHHEAELGKLLLEAKEAGVEFESWMVHHYCNTCDLHHEHGMPKGAR